MKKFLLYFFLSLFSVLIIFSAGVIDSLDGFQYLAVARNIYYKGEPTAPIYEYNTRKNIHMTAYTAKNGKTYSLTGLGFSLAYLPAVAITDFVYRYYGLTPTIHFPLENDWLILLTASFTNAFFGAILGTVLFIYFILLGLSKKKALFMSLMSIFATNLFVYTKHSLAHMMFITILMISFLLLKIYSIKKNKRLIFLCGLFYGILMITYNLTFILAAPVLLIYYLILIKFNTKLSLVKVGLRDMLLFTAGLVPFLLVYIWFENLRALPNMNLSSDIVSVGSNYLRNRTPISVIYEGIYGQLLSPGRSIFIYSPLLLIPIFFWHKIRKSLFPELFAFIIYSIILLFFYSKAFTVGGSDQGIATLWHGENSWGPRYLTPLIPLGMLLVGTLFNDLSKKSRIIIFYPLVIFGIFTQILGVMMPYQTKYFNMQDKFFVNSTEYPVQLYSNLLPRYTPIINMSKNLVKLVENFPKTLDHGIYNVRFYDGIDFPFNVGPERWRVVEGKGYISFDNNKDNPVKGITFGLINHPITEASESAKVQFVLNNTRLLEKPYQLKVAQRELIKLPINQDLVKPKDNQLMIEVDYGNQEIITQKKQILGLQSFDINDQRQNMESIDVPYVSSLGPKMAKVTYQNWGGTNQDPWRLWDLHTQTYERLPDFWWIRNLYYWDIPKSWILIPLAFNLFCLVVFGYKLFTVGKMKR